MKTANPKFKIVVPSFNSVDYLSKTLESIESQTYKNYDACIIDDCSTLKKQRSIILEFCQKNQWKSIFNDRNYGALYSIIQGIKALNCQDDEIIVMIDGDDWLYDEHVLEKLARLYSTQDIYLTWGQFETFPKGALQVRYAQAIPDIVIEKMLYRDIPDVFCHLKTYKYRLFRCINDRDLRDPNTGEYFKVSSDKALLYPMLEMAGEKIHYVNDILYVYNIDNPLNDFKINREDQRVASAYIRSLPKYKVLDF